MPLFRREHFDHDVATTLPSTEEHDRFFLDDVDAAPEGRVHGAGGMQVPGAADGDNDGVRAAGGSQTPADSRSTHIASETPKLMTRPPEPVTMTCVRCDVNIVDRFNEIPDMQRHCFNCTPKRAKVASTGTLKSGVSELAEQSPLMQPVTLASRRKENGQPQVGSS